LLPQEVFKTSVKPTRKLAIGLVHQVARLEERIAELKGKNPNRWNEAGMRLLTGYGHLAATMSLFLRWNRVLIRARHARMQVCEDRGGSIFYEQGILSPAGPLDILPGALSCAVRRGWKMRGEIEMLDLLNMQARLG
jgi:hypothetical protein